MRVLHINRNFVTTPLHRLMIDSLSAQGIENKVFVPICREDRIAVEPGDGVCVSQCFNFRDRYFFDYKQTKIIRAVKRNFNVGEYDLIHAYTLFTDGNVACKLSKRYAVPYVVAVRNTDVTSFFEKLPYLRSRGVKILRDAKAVFFLSNAYKKAVLEKYVPSSYRTEIENKTFVIPNGIDRFWFDNQFKEKKISSIKAPRLLLVGLVCKNKNIEIVQDTVGLLRKKGIEASLTVVGRVEDKELVARIQKRQFTKYLPPVPKEQLINIYREHDVFVLPSLTETFGLVYAEAMSQGLPVIYSRGQGFDGQFEEGVVGYSVDSRSVEEITQKIELVLEQYEDFSANCVVLVNKFRWSQIVKEYVKVYA